MIAEGQKPAAKNGTAQRLLARDHGTLDPRRQKADITARLQQIFRLISDLRLCCMAAAQEPHKLPLSSIQARPRHWAGLAPQEERQTRAGRTVPVARAGGRMSLLPGQQGGALVRGPAALG